MTKIEALRYLIDHAEMFDCPEGDDFASVAMGEKHGLAIDVAGELLAELEGGAASS